MLKGKINCLCFNLYTLVDLCLNLKKRKIEVKLSEEDYKENISNLVAEYEKKTIKSHVKIKKIMEATAINHRIWIEETAPSVDEILKMFPCLRTPQYVSSSL